MIASWGLLENELSQFRKEEGVTLADGVKTLGVDLRTRVMGLGSESEKKKVRGEVSRSQRRIRSSSKTT